MPIFLRKISSALARTNYIPTVVQHMKTDIINSNFLYNSKIHKVWKSLFLLYGLLLIFFTTSNGFTTLNKYEFLITIISKIFIGLGLLFFFLNMFIFSRIGKIEVENNLIHITSEDSKKTIDLNSIEEVTFGKENNKFYYLKIADSELIIELNKSQYSDFKNVLNKFNVNIKPKHFTDRIFKF